MSPARARGRRAAEMYLASIANGDRIAMRECAARYGLSLGTVHAAVAQLRKERAGSEATR
jgi:hypothetical protein